MANPVKAVVSRIKWIMWLFRAWSLVKSIREVIDFVNATHLTLAEISRELDKLCEKDENDGST